MSEENNILFEKKDEAEAFVRKARQLMCKNADIQIEERQLSKDVEIFEYKIINNGCKFRRRDGGAYCQECSDKYKNHE